jgi:hypothetical protein
MESAIAKKPEIYPSSESGSRFWLRNRATPTLVRILEIAHHVTSFGYKVQILSRPQDTYELVEEDWLVPA